MAIPIYGCKFEVEIMEAAKKVIVFSGPDSKRGGGGVKAGPLRKNIFLHC